MGLRIQHGRHAPRGPSRAAGQGNTGNSDFVGWGPLTHGIMGTQSSRRRSPPPRGQGGGGSTIPRELALNKLSVFEISGVAWVGTLRPTIAIIGLRLTQKSGLCSSKNLASFADSAPTCHTRTGPISRATRAGGTAERTKTTPKSNKVEQVSAFRARFPE